MPDQFENIQTIDGDDFVKVDPLLSDGVQKEIGVLADNGARVIRAEDYRTEITKGGERPIVLGLESEALKIFADTHQLVGYKQFRDKFNIYPEGGPDDEFRDQRVWAREFFEVVSRLKRAVVFVVDSQIDRDFEIENIDVSFTQAEYEWLVDYYRGQFPLTIVLGLEGQNIYLKEKLARA